MVNISGGKKAPIHKKGKGWVFGGMISCVTDGGKGEGRDELQKVGLGPGCGTHVGLETLGGLPWGEFGRNHSGGSGSRRSRSGEARD